MKKDTIPSIDIIEFYNRTVDNATQRINNSDLTREDEIKFYYQKLSTIISLMESVSIIDCKTYSEYSEQLDSFLQAEDTKLLQKL